MRYARSVSHADRPLGGDGPFDQVDRSVGRGKPAGLSDGDPRRPSGVLDTVPGAFSEAKRLWGERAHGRAGGPQPAPMATFGAPGQRFPPPRGGPIASHEKDGQS